MEMDQEEVEETVEGIQHVQILHPGDVLTQGETITLSLEDAAQLILQQQGLHGDGEGQLQPGTYQIITQQLDPSGDGQMQMTLANGISVIQAPDGTDLSAFGLGGQGIILQASNVDGESDPEMSLPVTDQTEDGQTSFSVSGTELLDPGGNLEQSKEEGNQEELDCQSENVLQIDLPVSQSESMLQVINHPLPLDANEPVLEGDNDNVLSFSQQPNFTMKEDEGVNDGVNDEEVPDDDNDQQLQPGLTYTIKQEVEDDDDKIPDDDQKIFSENEQVELYTDHDTSEVTETPAQSKKVTVKTEKPVKKPDLSKPIAVTDHMEVVVGGKKCLLKVNPDTGQLCAYPLVTTTSSGKRRGRPKKSEMVSKATNDTQGQDEAELEVGIVGEGDPASSAAEGLLELSNTGPDGIRRSGRARRKATSLDDYDMIEVSSDDEGAADEVEDEVLPSGAIRRRKPASRKDFLPASPVVNPIAKRGRGRPRRYPRPEETATSSQIPAMIIPSGDGQTIMMAPIQGLTNLEAFQEQVKNLSIFQSSKSDLTDEASQYLNTGSILSLDDGTQINIQLGPHSDQKLSEDADSTEDKLNGATEQDTDMEGVDLGEGSSSLMQAGLAQTDGITLNSDPSLKNQSSSSDEGQATIIQIPENLLPMFMQKKDPVKLGLKASDTHLEKWKCSKCGHQSYYDQQHQNHLTSHPEDTIKCKCCAFVSFDKEDLLNHFKVTHPRCICSVCDHMAEHAYVIKRHMMRHTQDGCRCDLCGKVYKDQYVLKMHVKMVHLPAEVLFECTICTKKFTRKAHLKRHLRIHDPQKPFKCPHCQYRGCEKSDISKHLLIHEDPKHTCEVCGKTFRHVKNKELHLKRHTGQRDYKCGVCDFYGYTFTDIRKHIERKHSDAKTYLCDKCGAAFKNEQLLREHRSQQCEVFMIEQALSIATSDGGTSQATIQIPSSLSLDGGGGHQLRLDGQNISIDNNGHITVQHLSEDGIGLSEEQLQVGVSQSHMTDTELHSVVSQSHMTDTELHSVVSQGHMTDIDQNQEGIIQSIGGEDQDQSEIIQAMGGEDQGSYSGVVDEDDVHLTEEDEANDIEDMDEDDIHETMQGIDDDKQHMVNVDDHMLGMVHIMR